MRTTVLLAAAIALSGCAARARPVSGPISGVPATVSADASGLRRVLERAISSQAGWETLRLLVECGEEGAPTSARVFGGGVGIWNEERQFRLRPAEIGALLRALQGADFPGMQGTYGGAPRPGRPPGGALVTIAICRIELSLGGHHKQVVQLAQGEQSPTLKRLAGDLLDICQPPARLGLTAASLRDGLEKVARGELAPEAFLLLAHRKPQKNDEPGFLLRIWGSQATTRAYDGAGSYGEPVALHLQASKLRALAGELAARDPERWPVNLYADDYTDLAMRVLNHEKSIQARQFAGLTPATHGRHQKAFEEVFEILERLAKKR